MPFSEEAIAAMRAEGLSDKQIAALDAGFTEADEHAPEVDTSDWTAAQQREAKRKFLSPVG